MASKSIRASLRASLPSALGRASYSRKSSPTLQSTKTHDVLHSIVKGRRSWKTLREGEIVWPPKLEAMLLEGLELYQPDDSRETRLLGRFPMRNRFISEYIFSKTGERRTARQVGSRLQQLKFTCNGKRLMNLLFPCRPPGAELCRSYHTVLDRPTEYDGDSARDTSIEPTTSNDVVPRFQSYDPNTRIVICIDILPDAPTGPYLFSLGQAPVPDGRSRKNVIQISQRPRPLRSIDPTVTFISRSPVSARSYFTVKSAGVSVFSETTPLMPIGPAPDGALLYSTTLVPGCWDEISESSDPTQYMIFQEVIQDGPSPSCLVFSAAYKFNYPFRNPHHIHSSSISSGSDEELHIRHDLRNSFNYLIPMDAPFPDMGRESVEPYNNLSTVDAKESWDVHLPSDSEMPVDRSPTYNQIQSCGKQDADFNFLPSSRRRVSASSPIDL